MDEFLIPLLRKDGQTTQFGTYLQILLPAASLETWAQGWLRAGPTQQKSTKLQTE